MIETTIERIGKRIEASGSIGEKDKAELLELLSALKTEVTDLSKTHSEHAESIAGFAQVSAHEATREQKNQNLVNLSLKGLVSSVEELEGSHPRLLETVNRISHILANMGI